MPIADSDRPAVLAHLRFRADHAAFAELDLQQRFQRIHDTNLWGASSSASGLGSEHEATAALRAELPALLRRLGVASLLDAPCGGGRWLGSVDLGVARVGLDIVPELIEALCDRAARGEIIGAFAVADITRDPLPRCQAVLCRDALVHLSFANIVRAIANFRSSGATWLLTTTFPDWQQNGDCEDGDWRALNFERPPFSWAPAVELINENCTEGGGLWRDKSLGAWRLADIAPA